MHDFNLTIPYGLILVAGGLAGYVRKGSTVSLAWGVGSGLVLLFAAFLSHSSSKKRTNSYIAFLLETVVALGLTWVLGQRFLKSYKIVPAGAITGLSFLMALFYLYKIASGGNRHNIPSSTKSE